MGTVTRGNTDPIPVKLPEFIIAGFSKCGTTGLGASLAQHPSVALGSRPPTGVSEMHFFNRNAHWALGLDWYRERFPDAPVVGEKTPSYVYDLRTMKRIAQTLPEVKLIFCLRNPADRLYSWYLHKVVRKRRGPVAEWPMHRFQEFHELEYYDPARTGCYASLLEANVLPHFPRERICFVIQEWLIQRGMAEVNRVLDFLGLGPIDGELRRVNRSTYREPLAEADRAMLLEYYRDHIERTFEIFGFRVPEWER